MGQCQRKHCLVDLYTIRKCSCTLWDCSQGYSGNLNYPASTSILGSSYHFFIPPVVSNTSRIFWHPLPPRQHVTWHLKFSHSPFLVETRWILRSFKAGIRFFRSLRCTVDSRYMTLAMEMNGKVWIFPLHINIYGVTAPAVVVVVVVLVFQPNRKAPVRKPVTTPPLTTLQSSAEKPMMEAASSSATLLLSSDLTFFTNAWKTATLRRGQGVPFRLLWGFMLLYDVFFRIPHIGPVLNFWCMILLAVVSNFWKAPIISIDLVYFQHHGRHPEKQRNQLLQLSQCRPWDWPTCWNTARTHGSWTEKSFPEQQKNLKLVHYCTNRFM